MTQDLPMTHVDLPPEFQKLPELQTDEERVKRMIAIAEALSEGRLTTKEQVETLLRTFDANVGIMGCSSHELETAKNQLDEIRLQKGHTINWV